MPPHFIVGPNPHVRISLRGSLSWCAARWSHHDAKQRCRVIRMPIAQERAEQQQQQQGDDNGETVVFDNLQSQEEAPGSNDDVEGGSEGLEGPLSFVLDDCPFGPGVMAVVKSMSKGEQCEAWMDPKHGPGKKERRAHPPFSHAPPKPKQCRSDVIVPCL